jgi:hypothetical protein
LYTQQKDSHSTHFVFTSLKSCFCFVFCFLFKFSLK